MFGQNGQQTFSDVDQMKDQVLKKLNELHCEALPLSEKKKKKEKREVY